MLICQEKKKNNRDVFLLTLVNKCDEMDHDENGPFMTDEEDQEIYDNIIKTTNICFFVPTHRLK